MNDTDKQTTNTLISARQTNNKLTISRNKTSNNLTKLNNKDLTKFNSKNLTKDFTSSFNKQLESINNWTNRSFELMTNETNEVIKEKDLMISNLEAIKNEEINDLLNSLQEKDNEINQLKEKGNTLLNSLKDNEIKIKQTLENNQKLLTEKGDFDTINANYLKELENVRTSKEVIALNNEFIAKCINLLKEKDIRYQTIVLEYELLFNQLNIELVEKAGKEVEYSTLQSKLANKEEKIKRITKQKDNEITRLSAYLASENNNLRESIREKAYLDQELFRRNRTINTLQVNLQQITHDKDELEQKYTQSTLDLKIKAKELTKLNQLNTKSKIKLTVYTGLSTLKPLIPFKWYDNNLTALAGTILVSELTNYPNLERITWISVFLFIGSSLIYSSYKITKFLISKAINIFSQKRIKNTQIAREIKENKIKAITIE